MTVDHYGVPFSTIEPGEIDQEQHDGVRDVFFVSHAVMLVRADLFRVLMADNRTLAPIAGEVQLARQYLAIESLRLGDRLKVTCATATEQLAERRGRRRAERVPACAVRCALQGVRAARVGGCCRPASCSASAKRSGLASRERAPARGPPGSRWFPGGRMVGPRRARAATQKLREVDDRRSATSWCGESAPSAPAGSTAERARPVLMRRGSAVRMEQTRDQMRRRPRILLGIVAVLIAIGSRSSSWTGSLTSAGSSRGRARVALVDIHVDLAVHDGGGGCRRRRCSPDVLPSTRCSGTVAWRKSAVASWSGAPARYVGHVPARALAHECLAAGGGRRHRVRRQPGGPRRDRPGRPRTARAVRAGAVRAARGDPRDHRQ